MTTIKRNTAEGVADLLRNRPTLDDGTFRNLDKAIARARITDRQAMCIAFHHALILSHSDVANELDITVEDVTKSLESAYRRIARQLTENGELRRWGRKAGEVR